MSSGNLQIIDCPPKHLEDYQAIVPDVVEEIRQLSRPIQGLKIAHVNATSLGGGVAEMLRSEVPLQQDIGLDSTWYVIPPNDQFFEVTKQIHNFMQGKEGELTEKQQRIFLDYNKYIAGLLAEVKADIFLIHDPQPAAALTFLNGQRPKMALWRCHIDTSHPNPQVWNFLLPFLKDYDRYIFTMPEYTNQDFPPDKIDLITPVIDPLSVKNIAMDKDEAKNYLEQFGIDPNKPLITQISRLDPWKDPEGVVDAYLLAKKKFPTLQLALVTQMANDDPEGAVIHERVKDYIKDETDIFVLVNLPDNDLAINAFQVASDIILQKSIREGFGLTVTEAMWKGAVVIGGNVGGIKIQIEDGKNGFLVNSPSEAAEKIIYLMENPAEIERFSLAAKSSVGSKFLLPHKLLKYLQVFNNMFKVEKSSVEDIYPPTIPA